MEQVRLPKKIAFNKYHSQQRDKKLSTQHNVRIGELPGSYYG